MATVIREYTACDGYNVRVVTGGAEHTLHFQEAPTTEVRDTVIEALEYRLTFEADTEEEV